MFNKGRIIKVVELDYPHNLAAYDNTRLKNHSTHWPGSRSLFYCAKAYSTVRFHSLLQV